MKAVMNRLGWIYPSTVAKTRDGAARLYCEQFGSPLPPGASSIDWPLTRKEELAKVFGDQVGHPVWERPQEEWIWNENHTAVNLFSVFINITPGGPIKFNENRGGNKA